MTILRVGPHGSGKGRSFGEIWEIYYNPKAGKTESETAQFRTEKIMQTEVCVLMVCVRSTVLLLLLLWRCRKRLRKLTAFCVRWSESRIKRD
jgi:glucan phosphoethanolaminetransferase (alkaline phosphatase superfamily)